MDERWRKGRRTFICTIDLRKAFDTVNLEVVSSILREANVPAALINRIITAILHERTSVQWYGRRTNQWTKGQGVKQGCPCSSLLFILIMHHTIKKAVQKMDIDLNYKTIVLPLILAYADDLVIVCDSLPTLETIFRELTTALRKVGLEINEKEMRNHDQRSCRREHPTTNHTVEYQFKS